MSPGQAAAHHAVIATHAAFVGDGLQRPALYWLTGDGGLVPQPVRLDFPALDEEGVPLHVVAHGMALATAIGQLPVPESTYGTAAVFWTASVDLTPEQRAAYTGDLADHPDARTEQTVLYTGLDGIVAAAAWHDGLMTRRGVEMAGGLNGHAEGSLLRVAGGAAVGLEILAHAARMRLGYSAAYLPSGGGLPQVV